MPWVRFTKAFDWQPRHNYIVAYEAGSEVLVSGRCAETAIAKGKAIAIERPQERKPSQAGELAVPLCAEKRTLRCNQSAAGQ